MNQEGGLLLRPALRPGKEALEAVMRKKLADAYVRLEKTAPALFFVSIIAVMQFEILSREFFGSSLPWNTEYCRYALVWVTFLGAVYVRRENAHIQVTALYDFLRKNGRKTIVFMLDLLRSLLSLWYWGVLAYGGYSLAERTVRFQSPAMRLSQYWLYICIPLCGALAGVIEVRDLVRLFTGEGGGKAPLRPGSKGEGEQ